ncbi:MAG TPA: 50S ribosomal protein L4 [Lentisphaeria bacterium]|nr:MAG: 50S ribosomal protein L4 [Lentisphaerae bacterium GWF2_38_69]HBM15459.1 50S ribosomal protein L4 [Lentisphaeria bacterium]
MNKNLKVFSIDGASVGDFAIQDQWIELKKGEQAVQDVVVAYRAGLRAGTASTKTRAMVRGGGAKPWRQKGTGRARAGSLRSPVFVGGGVAWGPHPRTYFKKVNKKVRKLALKRAFSEKINEDAIFIINSIELSECKTKSFVSILEKLGINDRKVLVAVKDYSENTLKASANLPNVLLMKVEAMNVYQMLLCDAILFTEEAIKEFVAKIN